MQSGKQRVIRMEAHHGVCPDESAISSISCLRRRFERPHVRPSLSSFTLDTVVVPPRANFGLPTGDRGVTLLARLLRGVSNGGAVAGTVICFLLYPRAGTGRFIGWSQYLY